MATTPDILLTIGLVLYGSDGSVRQAPEETLHFEQQGVCKAMHDTLDYHNWLNPYPVPSGSKAYSFTRWRLGECTEAKPAGDEAAPVPEKPTP